MGSVVGVGESGLGTVRLVPPLLPFGPGLQSAEALAANPKTNKQAKKRKKKRKSGFGIIKWYISLLFFITTLNPLMMMPTCLVLFYLSINTSANAVLQSCESVRGFMYTKRSAE